MPWATFLFQHIPEMEVDRLLKSGGFSEIEAENVKERAVEKEKKKDHRDNMKHYKQFAIQNEYTVCESDRRN